MSYVTIFPRARAKLVSDVRGQELDVFLRALTDFVDDGATSDDGLFGENLAEVLDEGVVFGREEMLRWECGIGDLWKIGILPTGDLDVLPHFAAGVF